jgi:putative membrane protein
MDTTDRNRTSRGALIAVAVVLLLVVFLGPGLGWATTGSGGFGPGMMGARGGGFAPWWGMGLAMPAFWLLVVGGLVLLVAAGGGRAGPSGGTNRGPLDILDERYARGELTGEQYERMREDLR